MARRDELLQLVTEYVLEHGLIGLSLRPMAAALNTSDRMLLYHFGSKDTLVAAVISESTRRSSETLRSLHPEPTVRAGVLSLWIALTAGQLDQCQRLYEQASASGLLGDEPYRSAVRQSNHIWTTALVDYLTKCSATRTGAGRVVLLLDASLMGFHLDYGIDEDSADLDRAIGDLADAIDRLAR